MKRSVDLIFAVTFIVMSAVVLTGGECVPRPPLDVKALFCDGGAGGRETASDCEALVFESGGSEIFGQILLPERSFGGAVPCVLIFHGFAGFGRFDDIGQALCRAGCVVLIPHHRGAWGSRGKYTVSHCVEDAVNLVRYVRSPAFRKKYRIDPEAVFLIGHSMGGNTVLNAAAEVPGVRGIVMLAPCDIGTMFRKMPKEEMKKFMIDNGLAVLRTDGFEAVYDDLARHAADHAFPKAAARLKDVDLLLVTGEWDTCVPGGPVKDFYAAACAAGKNRIRTFKSYRARHGLMGVRTRITRDIADFILESLK